MANAVTAYRDVSLVERGADDGLAAMLAYLDDSTAAPPQPPQPHPHPLPPLARVRRLGSTNLPPVRNILSHQEDWTKHNHPGAENHNNAILNKVRDWTARLIC